MSKSKTEDVIQLTHKLYRSDHEIRMTQDWNKAKQRGAYRYYIEKGGHIQAVHTSFGELDAPIDMAFLTSTLDEFLEK